MDGEITSEQTSEELFIQVLISHLRSSEGFAVLLGVPFRTSAFLVGISDSQSPNQVAWGNPFLITLAAQRLLKSGKEGSLSGGFNSYWCCASFLNVFQFLQSPVLCSPCASWSMEAVPMAGYAFLKTQRLYGKCTIPSNLSLQPHLINDVFMIF